MAPTSIEDTITEFYQEQTNGLFSQRHQGQNGSTIIAPDLLAKAADYNKMITPSEIEREDFIDNLVDGIVVINDPFKVAKLHFVFYIKPIPSSERSEYFNWALESYTS